MVVNRDEERFGQSARGAAQVIARLVKSTLLALPPPRVFSVLPSTKCPLHRRVQSHTHQDGHVVSRLFHGDEDATDTVLAAHFLTAGKPEGKAAQKEGAMRSDDVYPSRTVNMGDLANRNYLSEVVSHGSSQQISARLQNRVSSLTRLLATIRKALRSDDVVITARVASVLEKAEKLTKRTFESFSEGSDIFKFYADETGSLVEEALLAVGELDQVVKGDIPWCVELAGIQASAQTLLVALSGVIALLSVVTAWNLVRSSLPKEARDVSGATRAVS
jgi:hypothetical protein